jgi:Putative Ig domain
VVSRRCGIGAAVGAVGVRAEVRFRQRCKIGGSIASSPSQSFSPSTASSPSQSPSTSPSSSPVRSVSRSPSPSPSPSTSPSTAPSTNPSPSPSPTPAPLIPGVTPPFHAGEVAVAYNPVAMTATGGVQPYTWSVGAGALPDGLSLGSDGQVTGTPTRAGPFSFMVVVADSAGAKASLNASVPIVAALTVGFLRTCGSGGKCSVEQGCVSVCGGFGSQGGGAGPYSYNLTRGSVPPGTSLRGLSLNGKFTTTGTFNFKAPSQTGLARQQALAPASRCFRTSRLLRARTASVAIQAAMARVARS